jgi:hypothetical protein
MKKLQTILGGFVFVLGLVLILHAQQTAMPVQNEAIALASIANEDVSGLSDLEVELKAVELLPTIPADLLPPGGTFWSAQHAPGSREPWPPLPNSFGMGAWPLGNGDVFLLDDRNFVWGQRKKSKRVTTLQSGGGVHAMDEPSVPGDGGGDDGDDDSGGGSSIIPFSTNGLWLQILYVSNSVAYLNLMNATDYVYEIYSTAALTNGSNDWNIETEVFPTNTVAMPFTVPQLGRTNLFIWARDWTGITSFGNTTPEWWFYYWFGTIYLSDSDVDANGDTLLYDYTNNIAPNNMARTPVLLSTISVTDPVDIKWVAPGNLYVLSGSTATITEYAATNGSAIRSLSGLGSNPSGFDVDAAGNVYVALTSSNQVWKFNPSNTTFAADASFGNGGYIGNADGTPGGAPGQFNTLFDVAVSPDGGTISISESGNNQILEFDRNGDFLSSFGSSGNGIGQFSAPEALTYDSVGNLYIADSGNSRIVLANDSTVLDASGAYGTAFGQFNAPASVSVNDRGIYVADTGNNRIQCFNSLADGVYSFDLSDFRFAFSTNFSGSFSVAAVDNLTNEMFYVADSGNNRVLLYGFAAEDPIPAWTNMTAHVAVGDISGAASSFCNDTSDRYQQAFTYIGTNDLTSDISSIGALTPVYIKNDAAEYYFEKSIEGHTILFPVEFMKENGVWKIISF